MSTTIAVSGKGGSGKTTVASMLVRAVLERPDNGSVLCIDADPNSCLALALGVEPGTTVAEIREQSRTKPDDAGGMDRVRAFEYGLQQAVVEAGRFDLVTMGRPEGPSCYCAVNNLLRRILDELGSKYQFVIIDNEAGMEHLSRRTTNKVDLLCIVAEPTPVGVLTAQRIVGLARQLPIIVSETGVFWNRMDGGHPPTDELPTVGSAPEDSFVLQASKKGESVFALPESSPALQAVRGIVDSMVTGSQAKLTSKS